MRALGLFGGVLVVACSRTQLDVPTPNSSTSTGTNAPDPATFVTGSCASWVIGPASSIGPPDGTNPSIMVAAPAGEGALVGWLAEKTDFGMQLVHVDRHGVPDEPLPPVVLAPFQKDQQVQIAFALTNSHGHLGVARYEQRLGFAFTPVDVHGAPAGAEVQIDADPNDGFAHDIALYSAPAGFLAMDGEATTVETAHLLDFSGAVQSSVSLISSLPTGVMSAAIVTTSGAIIAFGLRHEAPSITDASGQTMHVLDPGAAAAFPSLFSENVDDVPIVTTGTDAGMSIARLQTDGTPIGAPATFGPTFGNCAAVTYTHESVVCATPRDGALDVQVFGFDGVARSPVLTSSLPTSSVPATLGVIATVPTATGALVFVEPPPEGHATAFAVELSCAQ
jgi:hypothetical protein